MTKIIAIVVIVVVIYGGWNLFLYWEKVQDNKETAEKQASVAPVVPEQLPGLPQQLEAPLQEAQKAGAPGLRTWLKQYDKFVRDPRRAWIQLDYVVLVSRDEPAEAKRVFAEVKNRTPPDSPVYNRIKQLEKTYE